MNEKLARIKQHVIENKIAYIVGASTAVVSGVVVYIAMRNNTGDVDFASPITNDIAIDGDHNITSIYNTIIQSVGNADNPSKPVFDKTTNTAFRSITDAAKLLDLNPRDISWHLKGNLPDVDGHIFESLIPSEV